MPFASIAISLALLTACAARPTDHGGDPVRPLGIAQRLERGAALFTLCERCPVPTAKTPFTAGVAVPGAPSPAPADKQGDLAPDCASPVPYTKHIYFDDTTVPDGGINTVSAIDRLLHPTQGDQ